jgi:hypothetical protein
MSINASGCCDRSSVFSASMWFMDERKPVRRIGGPIVAAGPAGVQIRTPLYLRGDEAAALAVISEFLGDVHRTPDRNLDRHLRDSPGLPASRRPLLDGDIVRSVAAAYCYELVVDPT